MSKRFGLTIMALLLTVVLAACGGGAKDTTTDGSAPATGQETGQTAEASAESAEPADAAGNDAKATRTIEYLGKTYTVPVNVERIVLTGSMEAHEDALVLDVHPVGAVTYAGKFPERFAPIMDNAVSIGEKAEPDFETILKLKPDVILGTTKFPAETAEQLGKIATMIPVSHIATDWEANLRLMGELTGKQEQAEQAIAAYKADLEAAKQRLPDKLKDKQVVALRLRNGQLFMYAPSVFVNPILYEDLGLPVPEAVAASKSQEAISVEQLAAMNPDYLFLQFAEEENVDKQNALQELLDNPIFKSTTAAKENRVFVNVIDPLAEGGPAWSRTHFLQAALERLAE